MSDVTRIYEIAGRSYSARQAAPLLADELARVVGERDRARDVAAALEGQVARVEELAVDFDDNVDWSNGRSNYGDNEAWVSAANQIRTALNPDADA